MGVYSPIIEWGFPFTDNDQAKNFLPVSMQVLCILLQSILRIFFKKLTLNLLSQKLIWLIYYWIGFFKNILAFLAWMVSRKKSEWRDPFWKRKKQLRKRHKGELSNVDKRPVIDLSACLRFIARYFEWWRSCLKFLTYEFCRCLLLLFNKIFFQFFFVIVVSLLRSFNLKIV